MSALKEQLKNYIIRRLGGSMVDVELDPEDYEIAIERSMDKFRQRSSNALQEAWIFLELQPSQNTYTLPKEIMEVRQIHRRGNGGATTSGGTEVDPFALAYTNLYLSKYGVEGGIATFDMFYQYQELAGRMFGRDILFNFNSVTHELVISRNITGPEDVALWCFKTKSDDELLQDVYAKIFIRDWATCECKLMLGAAYSKFSTIPGAGGGASLNGAELKTEAKEEMEQLEKDLNDKLFGDDPLSFVIG